METKDCPLCGPKPLSEFGRRPNGKSNSYCAPCQRDYSKSHYKINKSEHNVRRYRNKKVARASLRLHINQLKSVPCFDCQRIFPPWAMEFDHRDPSLKKFSIADATDGTSSERLKEEIEKCDIVCVVCHRFRTYDDTHVHGVKAW